MRSVAHGFIDTIFLVLLRLSRLRLSQRLEWPPAAAASPQYRAKAVSGDGLLVAPGSIVTGNHFRILTRYLRQVDLAAVVTRLPLATSV